MSDPTARLVHLSADSFNLDQDAALASMQKGRDAALLARTQETRTYAQPSDALKKLDAPEDDQ